MEAESFFARWSKRNAEAAEEKQAAAQPVPVDQAPPPPPTLEDVASLTPESDFKPFVARGVDESVRREAMKKLFTDPHFNVMDGLDVYIDDYNKFEPIPAAMLAMLNHAQALLNPLAQVENPLMQLLQAEDRKDEEQAAQPTPADEAPPPPEEPAPDATDMPPASPQADDPASH